MYPSSSSSSSSCSQSQTGLGLTRYGSAPGSLLTSSVDAVIGRPLHGQYYSTSTSNSKPHTSSYDAFPGSALLRQKSSPAGLLAHLAANQNGAAGAAGGFTITQSHGHGVSRLKSQLSFTGSAQGQDSLSQVTDPTTSDHTNSSYATFGTEPWDTCANSIVFSAPPTKRSKNNNNDNDADILHCLGALESQFSLPQTTLEMATMDKLLHIPQDSVPCKIRAKRGCATHPRSIAERERRTRISGKLKKLQDLVPNMDKQTSYADMLDLAVQHIKGLQSQVQKLHRELENCSCGCKQST